MKHEENTSIYVANDGCLIVRKSDSFLMGDRIDLGSADSIENYEDREYSKEELDAYYTSIRPEYREQEDSEFINPLDIVREES